jgi:hypothetical protein
MCKKDKSRTRRQQAGAAMLIAIFALLLISVIAIALIVSSGTESALASNYRTSTSAYYAGLAGLEEARGRLLWRNPDYVNIAIPGFMPASGNPSMTLPQVLYVINPMGGEVVAPTDLGNANTYPDNEYQQEFGIPVTSANVQIINSVSGAGGVPGPQFKWVRITPATEKSLKIDVDGSGGALNDTIPLNFESVNLAPGGSLKPGLVVTVAPNQTASQALEITALAVIPSSQKPTQKLLQYVVTPLKHGLYFHAALVIPGSTVVSPTVNFQGSQSGAFQVNGTDGSGFPPAIPGCAAGGPAMIGVGVSDFLGGPPPPNVTGVTSGIPSNPPPGFANNYIGQGVTPSVQDVFINAAMQSPTNLNNMVKTISQYADANINRNGTEADMPAAMSQANPMTVVFNGTLIINSNFTGYGLLVVTGDLIANADFGWKGVVLVVGSGNVFLDGGPGGASEFDGAMLVAHTMDTTVIPAAPLPALGSVNFNATNALSRGIYYNSCWIQMALRPPTYQILSFREITPN